MMKNRIFNRSCGLLVAFALLVSGHLFAQQTSLNLEAVVDRALENNKLYQIKSLQAEEKRAKVQEDQIKAYPAVSVSSTYQYNLNIGQLSIPQGSMGALPLPAGSIALPNSDLNFDLGKHHTFNAGATIYQPISQLGKIKTGVEVAKTDVEIAVWEKTKVSLQIRQAVEKLYYGILINGKQKEEANARLELARMKFYDLESANMAGKTIEPNTSGLQATIADEEQNLLKLEIQREDYLSDLSRLTGLPAGEIQLMPIDFTAEQPSKSLDEYRNGALDNNADIQLAGLGKLKSELAIRAAKLSYRPDFGLFVGYTYQKGNIIFPQNNPFAGASLKWNVQDIFSNKEVIRQRYLLAQQAELLLAEKKEEISNDVDKAYRRIRQAKMLIEVAERAYTYRSQELKVQEDRKLAGLNTAADVLNTRSLLARAEADLLSAQLNYKLAISDLMILTEHF
jgi:outer membrane protein